jgi:hypothetical protein
MAWQMASIISDIQAFITAPEMITVGVQAYLDKRQYRRGLPAVQREDAMSQATPILGALWHRGAHEQGFGGA